MLINSFETSFVAQISASHELGEVRSWRNAIHTLLEYDATTHATTFEQWKESAIMDSWTNLRAPTRVAMYDVSKEEWEGEGALVSV